MSFDGTTQLLPSWIFYRGFASERKTSKSHAHRTKQKHLSVWHLSSWNVRSLSDVEGSLETAKQGTGNSKDKRIDLVDSVLDKYKVVVGALQKTKWFRSEAHMGGKSLVLTAGRNVPGIGHVKRRGEGVAIVLTGPAIDA